MSTRRRAAYARLLFFAAATLLAGLLAAPGLATAHLIVDPVESPAGATQRYTIAVPSEKRSDTVKVEVQFPRALVVLQLHAPAGWRVTPQKDGAGRILGAIWEGGSTPFEQFAEFGVLAQNPNGSADLSWTAIQTYADGSEVQWFGPETSQFPAMVTHVRVAGSDVSRADVVAGAALVLALSALALGMVIRRSIRRSTSRQAPTTTRPVNGIPVVLEAASASTYAQGREMQASERDV